MFLLFSLSFCFFLLLSTTCLIRLHNTLFNFSLLYVISALSVSLQNVESKFTIANLREKT